MINIKNRKDCSGCTACEAICGHSAIEMVPDQMGFKYPIVDESKCVDCGLCDRVCPFNDDYDKSHILPEIKFYSVKHKDEKEVKTSRSGAAFIAIADFIISNGGVVYGVAFDNNFKVIHKRATDKKKVTEFKGSKYVQSDLNGIFKSVQNDLKYGLQVLFVGTPCQTAGLNSFLPKKLKDKLILVDIICHAVPSPKFWESYVDFLENKHNSKIKEVNFRNKLKYGWGPHNETFKFNNGKETSLLYEPYYTYLYNLGLNRRPSCNNCHYCNLSRPSDITIGDCWTKKNNINEEIYGLGNSLIICNTQKGNDILDRIYNDIELHKLEKKDCLQPNLQHPSPENSKSLEFEKDFIEHGVEYVLNKYTYKKNLKKRIHMILRRIRQRGNRIINHLLYKI